MTAPTTHIERHWRHPDASKLPWYS